MIDYAMFVEGLENLAGIEKLKPSIERAAYRAINATADWTRTRSADAILLQVAFPESYLRPSEGKLKVARYAAAGSLEAQIWARHQATSLARFAVKGKPGRKGVDVRVKKRAQAVSMPNAFLMKLRAGNAGIDTRSNLGLAVRTKRGEKPDRAYKPVRVSDTLWLLYGPSVNQVFKSVRGDVTPGAENYLATEFQRLLDLEL